MKLIEFRFAFFIICCLSCNTEGHEGYSHGIKDSKEKGVFMYSYDVKSGNKELKDSIISYIKEAYLEKAWYVHQKIKINDFNYNVIIISKVGKGLWSPKGYLIQRLYTKIDSARGIHSQLIESNELKDTINFTITNKSDVKVGMLQLIKHL